MGVQDAFLQGTLLGLRAPDRHPASTPSWNELPKGGHHLGCTRTQTLWAPSYGISVLLATVAEGDDIRGSLVPASCGISESTGHLRASQTHVAQGPAEEAP